MVNTERKAFVQSAISRFTSYWYEYILISRAIRLTQDNALLGGHGFGSLPSPSLLYTSQATSTEAELQAFLTELRESPSIDVTYFLTLFFIAEDLLGQIGSDTWSLPEPMVPPARFYSNLSFAAFVTLNNQGVRELQATRNSWVHNGGRKDVGYLRKQTKGFPDLPMLLESLPNFAFKKEMVTRLELPEGSILPIGRDYIFFAQALLLDRIILKTMDYLDLNDAHDVPFKLRPQFHY